MTRAELEQIQNTSSTLSYNLSTLLDKCWIQGTLALRVFFIEQKKKTKNRYLPCSYLIYSRSTTATCLLTADPTSGLVVGRGWNVYLIHDFAKPLSAQ